MNRRHLCHECERPIGNEQALLANGKLLHLRHFRCHFCQNSIEASDSFHPLHSNRKFACSSCFASKLAPKCFKCGKGITENGIFAAEKEWHADCFRCSKCQRLLRSTFLLNKEGGPIDHDCYWGEKLQRIVAESYKY